MRSRRLSRVFRMAVALVLHHFCMDPFDTNLHTHHVSIMCPTLSLIMVKSLTSGIVYHRDVFKSEIARLSQYLAVTDLWHENFPRNFGIKKIKRVQIVPYCM
jgi:hypothetical protein